MLELRNIHVHYDAIHALKGISLTVQSGEIVTLIGANGAGKSTTLMTISGIRSLTSGNITFEGRPIDRLRPDQIVRIGISQVPEGRRIFERLTVFENLLMGAYSLPSKKSFDFDLNNVFSLFPLLHERIQQAGRTLSGGEQQMLAIARSLMAHPKLLLLDEPSLGLAPLLIERVFDRIRAINATGVTVLLVEQNAHMALKLAHRAYVMETGRIIISGPSQVLIDDPVIKRAYLGESDTKPLDTVQ